MFISHPHPPLRKLSEGKEYIHVDYHCTSNSVQHITGIQYVFEEWLRVE